MPLHRTTSTVRFSIGKPGAVVKGKIISAGIPLQELAKKAGYKPSTLSDYLAGRTRNVDGQIRIMLAYCAVTGEVLKLRDFWGELTAEIAA